MARFVTFLFLVLLSFAVTGARTRSSSSRSRRERDDMTGHVPSTREEILAKREHRKEEFAGRLEDFQSQWEDHHSGRFLLKPFEVERLERKIKSYTGKLDHLNAEFHDGVRFKKVFV
jgi:hypothetical protein